jgi:hypothetical protein
MKTFFFSQDFEVTSHDNEISQYLFDFIENLLNLGGGKTQLSCENMLELVLVDMPSYTHITHTWVRAQTRLELTQTSAFRT